MCVQTNESSPVMRKSQAHIQCEQGATCTKLGGNVELRTTTEGAMRNCDTSSELLSVPDIPRKRRK